MEKGHQNKNPQPTRKEVGEEILGIMASLEGKVIAHPKKADLLRLYEHLEKGEVSPNDARAIARSVKFP